MYLGKRIQNWCIKTLGGYTPNEYKTMKLLCDARERMVETEKIATDFWYDRAKTVLHEKTDLLKSIKTCEAFIPMDELGGYTEDNIIGGSKVWAYYQLGKAVYPHAKHFITDRAYICAVNVQTEVGE